MAELRPLPLFAGPFTTLDGRYSAFADGKVLRVGLKMNTPPTCNWKCPYCYAGDPELDGRPRQPTVMTTSEAGSVPLHRDPTWERRMAGWLEQAIALGLQAVTVNGTFEPVAAPHWQDTISFLQQRGIAVTLVTNGGLLTPEAIDWIVASGVNLLTKLNVPVVAPGDPRRARLAEVQKYLSGLPRDAETVYAEQVALIERLVAAGLTTTDEPGRTRLGVESVIARDNLEFLPELVAQLRERNIYSHIELSKLQGFARTNPHLVIRRAEIEELFETVRRQDAAMGYEPYQAKPPCLAGACYENLYRLDLHADGAVRPCPGIETTIGDLNRQPLAEVLASPALAIIRNLDDHIQGDCRDCDLLATRQCYGGCRGTAYQAMANSGRGEYERWTASDPSCWRVHRVLDDGTLAQDVLDRPLTTEEIARLRLPDLVETGAAGATGAVGEGAR
ncbi:radical SAM additional 4Fe4S-binding domain protein [Frankia sp. QA3]|nr:radical SAM additional 4Fe4S-binding domain protein [Frankia sp. QA3]